MTQRDLPYQWICGDRGLRSQLLSDFRTAYGDFLLKLLPDTIAARLHPHIVTLETVAQDSMRERAHAGSGSFRTQKTREKCREDAAKQVRMRREDNDDDSENGVGNLRRKVAVQRTAAERQHLVEKATVTLQLHFGL